MTTLQEMRIEKLEAKHRQQLEELEGIIKSYKCGEHKKLLSKIKEMRSNGR